MYAAFLTLVRSFPQPLAIFAHIMRRHLMHVMIAATRGNDSHLIGCGKTIISGSQKVTPWWSLAAGLTPELTEEARKGTLWQGV